MTCLNAIPQQQFKNKSHEKIIEPNRRRSQILLRRFSGCSNGICTNLIVHPKPRLAI